MARYRPEHKEATRRRMIETAGRRFKSDGIDGSGIATLVADAGLTNGAFSVVADQLAAQLNLVNDLPRGLASVESFLRDYLSPAHRDNLAGGCPSTALLDEIGRCDIAVREAYTDGASAMISAIARHLDDRDAAAATQRAIGLFTLLVGSLQAARAVTDPELSERILAAAYANAMTLATA